MIPDQLTVIITTSPTPSNPSTDLISSVLKSFQQHCPSLIDARVIVVFDTFERITVQPRLKKGHASPELAANYTQYKTNIKQLILQTYTHGDTPLTLPPSEAEFGFNDAVPLRVSRTPDQRVTFIEPAARLGFGLAVRSALRLVETTYVWVQQHDWALVADIPLSHLLEIMRGRDSHASAPVRYISFLSVRMKRYAVSPLVTDHPVLRALTASLRTDFVVGSSASASATPAVDVGVTVPLTPLFFWFDKPHLASTAHYLARVFPTRLAIRRGEFIEDKIGQRARAQMKEGQWAKWATWLYYPEEGGLLCLRHLMGRTWRGFAPVRGGDAPVTLADAD